ncbi:histidine kinase/DNA gyrase B/HSP90-like ATPase [Methylobacterium radiotolerans]|nr:histidine kinase/DNA gyrase B/HSP90-like ATPase [Methylobacterium organophilum]
MIDQSLVWLDQTLSIITAVLRIGEIQHKHRCAAFSRVDVAQVLAEAAELYEPIAEDKSIRICLEVTHPFPFLTGDRAPLFEAVTNLIDNAVKFTPACGLVRLEVSRRGAICILAVEDTGPGIPPAERDQVFRRFYRAEPARHTVGNGLGLGLVAAIVELQGSGRHHRCARRWLPIRHSLPGDDRPG